MLFLHFDGGLYYYKFIWRTIPSENLSAAILALVPNPPEGSAGRRYLHVGGSCPPCWQFYRRTGPIQSGISQVELTR